MKTQVLAIMLILSNAGCDCAKAPEKPKLNFLQRLLNLKPANKQKEKVVPAQPPQERPQPAICASYKPNGEGFGLAGTRTLQNGLLVDDPGRLPAPHLVCRYHEYGLPADAQVSDNIDDCTCDN